MANTKQALKRARQSLKHRSNNKWQNTRLNTAIKQLLEAIAKKDAPLAKSLYSKTASIIDKMATKGLIHQNKAARHKSRLNKHILELG